MREEKAPPSRAEPSDSEPEPAPEEESPPDADQGHRGIEYDQQTLIEGEVPDPDRKILTGE